MDSELRDGSSNPHRKGDGCYKRDPDDPRSFRIPVKALNVIWGNDPRFWKWIKLPDEESRLIGFEEGAVLLQVNWIEVKGKFDVSTFKSASTTEYQIYYVVKFRVDAFGWHSVPIKFKVRLNGGETVKSVILESYRVKHDVWHEIPGGEFTVSDNTVGNVEFGMLEVNSDWWKGSMVLGGIKLKPIAG